MRRHIININHVQIMYNPGKELSNFHMMQLITNKNIFEMKYYQGYFE